MFVSIDVYCKRYVAHFLRSQLNSDGFFNGSSEARSKFRSLLKSKRRFRDCDKSKHPEQVTVKMSLTDAERYGAVLTQTSALELNTFLENYIKGLFAVHMHAMVNIAGFQVSHSIRVFQSDYLFTECKWSFDTLKKHYDRHLKTSNPLKAA